MSNTAQLASECEVSESDMTAFIEGIRLQIAKGFTLEEAIERLGKAMGSAVQTVYKAKDSAKREYVAGCFF